MAEINLLARGMDFLAAQDKVTVAHTDDSFAALDEYIRNGKIKTVAVFTGRKSADDSGAWSKLLMALRFNDCAVIRFKDIPAEPDMETVAEMTDFLYRTEPDAVIALGGGSVMDASKAAYIVFQSKLTLEDCFGSNKICTLCPGKNFKRIIAIPTTSGTGSELTQYSNIVNCRNGVKQLISDSNLIPVLALFNASLTVSMPRSVTLATGCDALAHLLEGWLNVTMDEGNAHINAAAQCGVELLQKNLLEALENPTELKVRKNVQIASALGGLTIRSKSTGLPHLLSFSWFGRIEHGIAAARLLPAAWRYYIGRKEVVHRTLEIGRTLGGNTPEEVINNYEKLLDLWQVPHLSEFPDLTAELLKQTCRSAGANKMKLELAPRPVPLEQSEEVLQSVLDAAMRN